jgi:hypothetical protein
MKRFVLLTSVGLGLLTIAGCHHWRNKHFARASYTYADPCGCGDVYPGPIEGVPVAAAQSLPIAPGKVIPGPPSAVISTPQR